MSWFDQLLDLVLPPRCGGCRAAGAWYCERCRGLTRWLEEPLCARCGAELPFMGAHCGCRLRFADHIVAAVAMEGPVENAMHRFKYGGCRRLAEPLAQLVAEGLARRPLTARNAVAVPLHPSRRRLRGFNQAELLLRELRRMAVVTQPRGRLMRVREARPQVGLDRLRRLSNLDGAYRWHGEDLRQVPVIVVDDVSTTGATLDACAQALKAGGAGMVIGLTVARVRSF